MTLSQKEHNLRRQLSTAFFLSVCLTAVPAAAYAGPQKPDEKPDQKQQQEQKQQQKPEQKSSESNEKSAASKPQKSVTQGSVTVRGTKIAYDATAGLMILKNKDEKPIASMSYVAYTKGGVDDVSQRPITFFYNGGPGSSTIWLHMLAFGPRRVVVGNGTMTPPAPYRMENNDDSLLDATDMVFIDAPGTGFGRVLGKDAGGEGTPKDVFGVDEDAGAFADSSRSTSPRTTAGRRRSICSAKATERSGPPCSPTCWSRAAASA